MKRFISCLMSITIAFGPGFPLAAFAGPDDFIGDAGIYVGAPSQRPKPNVLFVIDRSQATLNVASGSPYDPTFTYPDAGYASWNIYSGDNQGDFSKLAVANSTSAFENLTADSCADIVRTTLLAAGTYSGSGTEEYPNIKAGQCDSAPKGAVYALGNYLNYLNYVAIDDGDADDDGILDGDDQCPGFDDSIDTDGDSVPDGCDICPGYDDNVDSDGDTVPDGCDICPGFDDRVDSDHDGIPDGCDTLTDSDGDGVDDALDQCPGFDDIVDTDGDSVPDGCDICPGFDDRVDSDNDGIPDGCDIFFAQDDDGDGVRNYLDQCPGTPSGAVVNSVGCPDSDGDGQYDNVDPCPSDNPDDPDGNDICGYQPPPCTSPYTYVIVNKSNSKYELTQSHISSNANAPSGGGNAYWTKITGNNDQRAVNFGDWKSEFNYKMPADYCSAMLDSTDQPVFSTLAAVMTRAMPVVSASVAALGGVMSLFESNAEAAPPPVGVSGMTQREIIYNALAQVVGGARTVVNFGAISYGGNNHGADVLYDIADLSDDTQFTAFKNAIPGPGPNDGVAAISSNSVRPLSSALYDAGYYYGAEYSSVRIGSRIPDAVKNACGYDHIIVITNGLPNNDASNPMPATIGDADGDGVNEDVYGLGDHYLDDVAYYLRQNYGVKTHAVLAFQPSDPLVERTAANGGGQFYNAYDAQQLADALTRLMISIILEADTAFVAPVVPASATNRTISSDRVYLGLFKPQIEEPWLGNVKKYRVGAGNHLIDRQGNAATDPYSGEFVETSQSYWGTGQDADGNDIFYCFDGNRQISAGDGGMVGCGGVGGSLLARDFSSDPRKIYTYPPTSASKELTNSDNAFTTANAKITVPLLNVADVTSKNNLINFMYGYDVEGIDPTAKRNWILGDILHSRPLVFNYAGYTSSVENTCAEDVASGAPYNSSVMFVGANDGMLHAFRDCDGKELWAFIPPQLLSTIKEYPSGAHHYYVDSPPVAYVHDVDNDGNIETADGDKIVLIFGLRRGGASSDIDNDDPWGAYYALDVSTPTAPVMLWQLDNTVSGLERMGQSWSQPRLSKINDNGTIKVVAFITGGYDKNEDLRYGQTQSFPDTTDDDVANGSAVVPVQVDDGGLFGSAGKTSPGSSIQYKLRGNAVYAIEVATLNNTNGVFSPVFSNSGAVTWAYDVDDNVSMTYAFASDITLLSSAGNFADTFYVGDTGGRMWRFDVSGSDKYQWGGEIIFDSNSGTGSDVGRKIFYRPAAALISGKVHLWFGTGDRAHPLNHAVTDRIYHLVDMGQVTVSGIDEARLVDLTDDPLQTGSLETVTLTLDKLHNNAFNSDVTSDPNYPFHGWFVKMDWDFENSVGSATAVGEKVLAAPVMFNNEAYYTTYTPSADPNADNPCAVGNLGTSQLYHVSALTGESVFNYDLSNDSDYDDLPEDSRARGANGQVLSRSDRVRQLGEGIPSGIVTLIDASGRVTMMISSSNRVETYNAPDIRLISPVYWMQW